MFLCFILFFGPPQKLFLHQGRIYVVSVPVYLNYFPDICSPNVFKIRCFKRGIDSDGRPISTQNGRKTSPLWENWVFRRRTGTFL